MKQRIPFLLFLALYVLFVLTTYRHYGVTWDERDVYKEGLSLFNYFTQSFHLFAAPPLYVSDPEHNYPYAVLLTWLNPSLSWSVYHLLNMLFALVLYGAAYELLFWKYQRPWLALTGPLFLFLTLPFSGSVPGNPKDIPFAIFYFLTLMMIYFFEERWPLFRAKGLVIGILLGLTISSRIVGFTLLPIWFLFDVFLYASKNNLGSFKTTAFNQWLFQKILDWALGSATALFLCSVLWPYLGRDFFQHLTNVLWLSANFPPRFSFLFMGHLTDTLHYPWYYLPLWMVITLPLFILGFFTVVLVKFKLTSQNKLYFLMGLALLFNVLTYLVLKPAVYDGLRHFLYLLPLVSLLASIGLVEWLNDKGLSTFQKVFLGAAGLNVLMVVFHLFALHPYEYIYFNEITGGTKGAYGRFETDYWAASIKESVEWLTTHEIKDPKKTYKIYAEGEPFQSLLFFTANMKMAPKVEADYCILITRMGGKPRPEDEAKVIHVVEREGVPLSFILKMK